MALFLTFANAKLAVQKPSVGADTEHESVALDLSDLELAMPAEVEIPKPVEVEELKLSF